MGRPRVLLDLDPVLQGELFDRSRIERLRSIAELASATDTRHPDDRFDYDVVVTGWGSQPFPNTRPAASPLALVAHSAGTIRRIVPRDLMAEGVRVTQAASGMAVSVSELALTFAISLLRNLQLVDRSMVRRDWDAALSHPLGQTIAGARIGVIGASRVGRAYIEHVVGMGAEVVVSDPYLPLAEANEMGVELVGLDHLFATSRVVALHAPVTSETVGMVSRERLASIPDGGIIINTARAAIVDMPALVDELRSGRLSAALDVFDAEPLPSDSALWDLPNVILTPHIGAVTVHSRAMQGDVVVDEIERFLNGSALVFEVTPDNYDRLA